MANEKLKGNQFWKLRTKHGRASLFSSAEILMGEIQKYFDWCDSHPFYKITPMSVGQGAGLGSVIELVKTPIRRPYTWEGLCIYLNVGVGYFRQFKTQKECSPDISALIDLVGKMIHQQQFSGASIGEFNANIISRYLGLADKQINENQNYNSTPMTKEEVKEIGKQLEDEV